MKTPKQKDSAMKIVKALAKIPAKNIGYEITGDLVIVSLFNQAPANVHQRARRFLKDKK